MSGEGAAYAALNLSLEPPVAEARLQDSALVLHGEALRDIVQARMRQIEKHGFTLNHDLGHSPVDLGEGAVSYLGTAIEQLGVVASGASEPPATWPWDSGFWRPRDARANLVKAAALCWAAIDRLDRTPRDSGEAPITAADLPY